MTTSMYCLYVGFDYTYIDINALAQGIKSFSIIYIYIYVCVCVCARARVCVLNLITDYMTFYFGHLSQCFRA